MERILIIGCGCSGKSTLARKLGERLNLPVVHLDKLWWRGNWENPTTEEFDALLAEELQKPCWIMDGNYSRTLPRRLSRCDTVIYLDFSRFACLRGMVKRVLSGYGKTRPDMGGNCPERFDREFIGWIWNFRRDVRPELLSLLETAEGKNIIILKNRREVNAFTRRLAGKE